jgi:hypothetical protein
METGSEVVIQLMRKKFKLETAERLLRVARESGVSTTVSVIFGHPGETEVEYYNSINFMKKIAKNVDRFLFNTLGIYGDSHLSRNLEEFGVTQSHPLNWVGDGGANTIDVRRNRKLNALNLFGDKVVDIGDFAALGMNDDEPFIRYSARAAKLLELPDQTLAIKNAIEQNLVKNSEFAHGFYEFHEYVEQERKLRVRGWATTTASCGPVPYVALVLSGRVVGVCSPAVRRRDVLLAKQTPSALFAGWETAIDADLLKGASLQKLMAFAVDPVTKQMSPLRRLIESYPVIS